VIAVFSGEPFEKDHRRLLENAATLFASSIAEPLSNGGDKPAKVSQGSASKSHIH
jgi:hypothetical protein